MLDRPKYNFVDIMIELGENSKKKMEMKNSKVNVEDTDPKSKLHKKERGPPLAMKR